MSCKNARNQILVGECRQQLATLPADWFHTAITSPPYWGLRSYLPAGHADKALEIGSEPSPEEFIATMVDVFRAVRRVLRDDGTLWLNMGDSYASAWPCSRQNKIGNGSLEDGTRANRPPRLGGAKEGEQMLMPHRVAMALQADGWYLRSTIIWAKKSPMPESISGWRWVRCRVKVANCDRAENQARDGDIVRQSAAVASRAQRESHDPSSNWSPCPGCPKCLPNDGYILRKGKWRPTTAHEYLFLFSKSERYFCDGDAVQEAASFAGSGRTSKVRGEFDGKGSPMAGREPFRAITETRNPRSVWSLSNEPYKGAHFATFPTRLIKPCIEAGTSKAGCCSACGSQWAPVVESERVATRPGTDSKVNGAMHPDSPYMDHAAIGNRDPQRHVAVTRVTSHRPTCSCPPAAPERCRVLDPFGGSGTTAQVAQAIGRDWTICELNPEYVPLARARIDVLPKWALPEKQPKRRRKAVAEPTLFEKS